MTNNPALTNPAIAPVIDRGVSDLIDRPRLISPAVVRAVIARVAHESYQAGRSAALSSLMPTERVAAELGVAQSRVVALARSRGAGMQVGPRAWVFTPEDVEAMRPGPSGRPRKADP